jgi:hypothetical protein
MVSGILKDYQLSHVTLSMASQQCLEYSQLFRKQACPFWKKNMTGTPTADTSLRKEWAFHVLLAGLQKPCMLAPCPALLCVNHLLKSCCALPGPVKATQHRLIPHAKRYMMSASNLAAA